MSRIEHTFCDGKYTVIFDESNGHLSALRNGEPWSHDIIGDKLILSMLSDYDALKATHEVALKDLCSAHESCYELNQSVKNREETIEHFQKLYGESDEKLTEALANNKRLAGLVVDLEARNKSLTEMMLSVDRRRVEAVLQRAGFGALLSEVHASGALKDHHDLRERVECAAQDHEDNLKNGGA
jgi:hypothetical protein